MATSSSSPGHSFTILLAPSSLGSFVSGLLHRSMVFAYFLVALPHQVSHHSHSCRGKSTHTPPLYTQCHPVREDDPANHPDSHAYRQAKWM